MIKYKISKNPDILFVGINPHFGSFQRGIPFSNNKMFWYLLSDAGLIAETRKFLKDDENLKKFYDNEFLNKYNFNIINIVDRPSRTATHFLKEEVDAGIRRLNDIIIRNHPKVVCFVGKVTFQTYSREKNIRYGRQKNILSSKVYVMHFPIRGSKNVRIKELKAIKKLISPNVSQSIPSAYQPYSSHSD